MRANFIIVLCVALFLESVVSFVDHEPSMKYSSHEARGLAAPDPSIKYPSSDQRSLSGPPTWKDDFDIETDLSPEDRALIEEAEENFQTLLKSRQANKAAKRQQAKQVFAAMSLEDRKLALADAQRERVEEASKKLTKETLEASKKLTKEASKMLTTDDDDNSEVASNASN